MVGTRFILCCFAAIGFALMVVQEGATQTLSQWTLQSSSKDAGTATCKIYSLADLGNDSDLCKWVAETIPVMIQPKSWKEEQHKLSYHAPSKVLVVNHTPAVHVQVDEFLQNLKKSLPRATAHDPLVAPAQHAVPDNARPMPMPPYQPAYQASYPVPFPPQAPKHLFHFIIRYEGAGVIDENVANFAKSLTQESGANAVRQYTTPPNLPMADMGTNFELPPPPPPSGPPNAPVPTSSYRVIGQPEAMPVPLPNPRATPAPMLPPTGPPMVGSSNLPVSSARPRMPLADVPPMPIATPKIGQPAQLN